jgi:hypothetical protein
MADIRRRMRQATSLLWIRTAPPGAAEINLMENLSRFAIRVVHNMGGAMNYFRCANGGVVFAEFPVAGADPADLLDAVQEASPPNTGSHP